jgi:putative transposase
MSSFNVSGFDTNPSAGLTFWDWPHAPAHRLSEKGAYMVTAGTYEKRHFLNSADRCDLVLSLLFKCAAEFEWQLQAWAVLSNHYHFVALSPDDPGNLGLMLGKLHGAISGKLNAEDGTAGRKVFYQYWDTHITFQRSYLARLNYVHQNPVHHGVARSASEYRWCSAAWFERKARPAFVKSVYRFKMDRISIKDDF